MKKDKLSTDIINASKAVRKKQLALKRGRIEEQSLLETRFKPITEPLEKLLKTNVEVKQEPKIEYSPPASPVEEKLFARTQKTPIAPIDTPTTSSHSYNTPPVNKSLAAELEDIGYDPFTKEEQEQLDVEKSFQKYRDLYEHFLDTKPEVVKTFLEQYEPLPRVYVDRLITDKQGEYDRTKGPRFDAEESKLKLGNAILEIDGNDIIVDNIRYKGTVGLYELIFKNKPIGYTEEDSQRYRDILNRTNVHRRDNNPANQIRGNRSHKHVNIIKPLTLQPRASPVSGRGHIGKKMVLSKAPYQFVYWDDINEIVDRLKLLIASGQAGHTSHTNEISSIVEELKEAGVIY